MLKCLVATVGHGGDLLRPDHVLAVVPEGHVLLVVGVGVGRAEADGGVTPVGEEAASVAEGPEKLNKANFVLITKFN